MAQEHPSIQEDEIDLQALFSTIWRRKWTLFFFSLLITSLALLYVLMTPNQYISKTILIPKNQDKSTLGAGAAAMASMAGIDLNGNQGSLDIGALFKDLVHDYAFTKTLINKHNLLQKLDETQMQEHLVYVFNGASMQDDFSKLFSSNDKDKETEERLFEMFKALGNIISVNTDKETGAITLSAQIADRYLAKELVQIYLKEMSDYIKKLDLKEIDDQVNYYESELYGTSNLDLKSNITELLSALVRKKVLSQAGEFYMVKQLTQPEISYIKDKSKPKRSLILIIAWITSLLLGIFYILFRESLRK